MKDYIRIFGRKIRRSSILYKTIRFVGKTGPITGPLLTNGKIDINRIDVPINNLPDAFNGLKLLHLSDIHAGDYIRPAYIKRIVKLSNELDPDIVFITGDFTETDPKHAPWAVEILATLKNKYGIFAVLGNHDIWNGDQEISKELAKNNIELLRNSNQPVSINNETLYVAGVDDYKFGEPNLAIAIKDIPESSVTILLSHHPDIVEQLNGKKIDLMLAGHMHGGQWILPFIGPPLVPTKFGMKHFSGMSKANDTYVYTSKGIGTTTVPLRINCPPEITLLTLLQP